MTEKMRAVRLFAPGDIRCTTVDIPAVKNKDDVLIKVKACGVCGSDIPRVMVKGTYSYPMTIGHEFSGEVAETGAGVTKVKPGDRVTVVPLVNCKKCDYCRTGNMVVCDEYDYFGSRIDGAMAEYIVVSESNVLKVPDNVSFYEAAMTDPTAIALRAVRKANLEAGQTAVVFGLGAIGYIAVQWLKNLGCSKVIAIDVIDEKLKLAEELGADVCLNGEKTDVVKAIMDCTNGKGADASIEIAGNKISQVQAIDTVRKMGTVVYCGISYDDLLIPNRTLSKILRGEINIKGTWNSSSEPFPVNEWEASLKFVSDGKIKLKNLITHVVRLEDCKRTFEMMFNRTEVFTKVIFDPTI